MDVKKLKINGSCWFEVIAFTTGDDPMISINYIEHSNDHYNPDSETYIEIDKEMATKIIEFLREAIDEAL